MLLILEIPAVNWNEWSIIEMCVELKAANSEEPGIEEEVVFCTSWIY